MPGRGSERSERERRTCGPYSKPAVSQAAVTI